MARRMRQGMSRGSGQTRFCLNLPGEVTQPGTADSRAARAEYVLSVDADSYPAGDDWAQQHVEALSAASQNVLASTGPVLPVPSVGRWWSRPELTPQAGRGSSGEILYAVGPNRCVRSDMLRRLGGFPAFRGDDVVLGRIARESGLGFCWVEGATVFHHNPVNLSGYYRQMRKVGGYSAESNTRPRCLAPWRCVQVVRGLGKAGRELASRRAMDGLATSLRVFAQTSGAVEVWRNV